MSIDRDSYEPIDGNPRRDSKGDNGDPTGPDEDTSSPDGDPAGPSGAPSGPERDSSSAGSPSGPNGDPEETHSPTDGQAPGKESNGSRPKTGGRTRRVKVTPNDWDDLERLSDHFGVGYAKVYRIAFRRLLRDLEGAG